MKITRPGNCPSPERLWWIGKTIQCSSCKTQIELEDGDNERSPTALRSNPPFITVHSEPGRHYVAAACPTRGCGETITLTRVREVEA